MEWGAFFQPRGWYFTYLWGTALKVNSFSWNFLSTSWDSSLLSVMKPPFLDYPSLPVHCSGSLGTYFGGKDSTRLQGSWKVGIGNAESKSHRFCTEQGLFFPSLVGMLIHKALIVVINGKHMLELLLIAAVWKLMIWNSPATLRWPLIKFQACLFNLQN